MSNLIVITKRKIQTPIILVHDVYCTTLKTGIDGCIYVLFNSNSIISVVFYILWTLMICIVNNIHVTIKSNQSIYINHNNIFIQ